MSTYAKNSNAMVEIPCISVRQPWASAIIDLEKDVENRDWFTRYRGPLLIHAASMNGYKIIDREFEDIPQTKDFKRGGIVGIADLVDCRDCDITSKWWDGDNYGFVLENMTELAFYPCRGKQRIYGQVVPEILLDEAGYNLDKTISVLKPQDEGIIISSRRMFVELWKNNREKNRRAKNGTKQ